MRVIIVLLFVGYILIWFLLPTKQYKNNWTPTLETDLESTYFQSQGRNLLLFSFPVMLIAVCGSVYLHFQKKQARITTSTISGGLSFWRRPVVVLNPLGIVTAVELAFSAMFIVLLIWSLANYVYVSFGNLHMNHGIKVEVWQSKFRSVSLRLGYIGNITWAFLFFPVTRGSPILGIFGLTSESSIKYHIWLGHISMVLFSAHTIGFITYYAMTHQMAEMIEWSQTYVSNVAGEIAIVFALGMWVTSFYSTRRKKFEVFFYTHHLYIVYIIFYALHVGAAYFCMVLPGIFLFLIDRYLRFLQSMQHARLLSARLLPSGTLELNFSKHPGLHYNPTSIMFLNVPSISKLQWHPFTVSSNSEMESDVVSVVIKREGSWSQKLFNQISSSVQHFQISVEGPYGPNSSHFLRHELLVMISGGSGIASFISIIREIIFESRKPNRKVPRVLLICAFKKAADIAMLDLLLPMNVSDSQILNQVELQIEAYITKDQEQPSFTDNTKTETKWFKPHPKDSPVTSPLGPNNWLWFAAIIASSFLMFLLLLAIINRYYIYPIDKNTNKIYHYSFFVIWDMFLGCASIVILSSVVFLWRKKQNVNAIAQQIQNFEMEMEMETPAEVESLPRQSLVETTNFGARPDLKGILLGCKGSDDVGVLASGPRTLRHEVAKICSSGLADNLYFESISFSWRDVVESTDNIDVDFELSEKFEDYKGSDDDIFPSMRGNADDEGLPRQDRRDEGNSVP
ncbi:ferric reduction oxidase 4-like [Euphorbia lathyris]|uniref:ferric reduction oxidase 4-like n=1 Tax=Euphorbia lathyris TaxID=212925 RepID=UPI00331364BB